MNAFDILLIALIGVIVFFAARRTLRMRKNGGCSCASGCSGSCPACGGTCHCNTDRNKPGET